ncbi:flagellar motor protein MotB [Ornithinibacillus sp. L9]|uniref:Flagellar motor protein MotB n=1 Tax=Ornithinibacillus caprae TaxID=2678566 RepID=A0A6N8FF14_9BACI|nr:flagellar motor protein MotS [Ornithinibacillus caprae]MUK86814.1 flagellar motor protein MotB [Ornithinibacillus caprae]
MKRREVKRSKKMGAPKWMVTYSDMVTLILVFFILLFSMSQIDLVKFEAVSESFRNQKIFDFYPSPVPMENPTEQTSHEESGKNSNEFDTPSLVEDEDSDADQDRDDEEEGAQDSLQELMGDIENYLDQNDLNDVISASRTEKGVVLVLQDSILFDFGEAEIIDTAVPFLNKVGALLSSIPNHIRVEGHTDTVPVSSYRYPSNWELSGARASSVVRYLVDENELDQTRFSITGFGETRPVVPNNSDENRSKNRRVEIVILESKAE